jgi:hypothetical protein
VVILFCFAVALFMFFFRLAMFCIKGLENNYTFYTYGHNNININSLAGVILVFFLHYNYTDFLH